MTLELAQSCSGYVTTIINNTDVVPTISPGTVSCQLGCVVAIFRRGVMKEQAPPHSQQRMLASVCLGGSHMSVHMLGLI